MGGWAVRRFVAKRAGGGVSSDKPQFLAHLLEGAERKIEIVARVSRRQLAADTRMSLWHNRITEPSHKDSLGEQQLTHVNGLRRLAQDHRDDRRLARERLEAEGEQLFAEVARV